MTKPNIPNADLIRAVLDGKPVQWKTPGEKKFVDMSMGMPESAIKAMLDYSDCEFRLKPEPMVRWALVDPAGIAGFGERKNAAAAARDARGVGVPAKVLRLELDDELNVISAETEEP